MVCSRFSSANRFKSPRGFTLVELLVVIAIIGILVGLLLPAVQAAREAARRCQCSNNIAQLGLAIHNHDFAVEHFPAGVINPTGPIRNEAVGQHVSWIVQILPYMEQSAVYQHFDQAEGTYSGVNRDARIQRIASILCPSNPVYGAGDGVSEGALALTHYAGCHHDSEAPIDTDNKGVLFLNSRIRFGDIRDGSSQTILVGEILGSSDSLGWASGTRATLRNTGFFEQPKQADQPAVPALAPGALNVGGFGSYHTGGAQFSFADGSVHFLSQNIDKDLYRKLGNRADGEMLFDTAYGIY